MSDRDPNENRDPLAVVDAAYRFDVAPDAWLRELARAIYPQIGAGLGLLGFDYRVTDEERLQIGGAFALDMPEEMAAQSRMALEQLPPEYVRKTFVRCECTTQSQVRDPEVRALNRPMMEAMTAMFGWRDIFMIGGMDPEGYGIYLGAWLPKPTRLAPAVRATWSRVAVHRVTAQRLRRRLAGGADADAVLQPSGTIEAARGEADGREARQALETAVRDLERSRAASGEREIEAAVKRRKGLVSARWSLVDHFESDGKRYLLARRNDAEVRGAEVLTLRERQAAGYAALGHSNKLIAYEMGVSPSTVGVLLHRAARKLDAQTRDELIAKLRRP